MVVPGNLYILTAPSGAGKTTLAQQLVATLPDIQLSVSYTTRQIRPGERSGIDYWFIDDSQFQTMLKQGAFLEYAKVHNHFYGTSRERVEACLKVGIDVILAIDWQGAQQIRQLFKELVSIFILPPSEEVLRQRLQLRRQDDNQVIKQRLSAAAGEVAHYKEFDYVLINDVLEDALQDIQSIVRAHRLRRPKQALRHAKLLAQWLADR